MDVTADVDPVERWIALVGRPGSRLSGSSSCDEEPAEEQSLPSRAPGPADDHDAAPRSGVR